MCGRYTITVTLEELMEIFDLEDATGIGPYRPRYNIAPTQMVPAIIAHEGRNRIGELRWGLIPQWAKDDKVGFQTINAKAETIIEKPAFRTPFMRKRCLIPADGFFEWKKDGSAKQPYRIVLKDRKLFAMAGLYDTWINPDGQKISSCTIITTTPNELMADIHNRMPVILRREDEAAWLDRANQDTEQLLSLLKPYASDLMKAYRVSSAVGNVRNDSPELIKQEA